MLIARHRFPGRAALNALIDLPLAVSPVVVGLALILVYGRFEPIGRFLDGHGIKVIFSLPGMVLATIFVSLPLLVARARAGARGDRHRTGAGGLDARCVRIPDLPPHHVARDPLGARVRRGAHASPARSVSSEPWRWCRGGLVGKTQTLTLYVQQEFQNFDPIGAYAASFVLAVIAILVLIIINVLRPKEHS